MNAPVFLTALIALLLLASVPMASEDARHGAYNTGPDGTSRLFSDIADVRLAHGRLAPDPSTTFIIAGPVVAFTDAETLAIRDFVAEGGRLLIADNVGSAGGLLARMDVGVELSGVPVYTPVFETDPQSPLVTGTGAVPGITGTFTLPRATAVVGDGAAVMATNDLAWLDLDGDGRPDLDEPQDAYAYAMLQPFGQGDILVIGSPSVLDNGGHPVRDALIAWAADGRTVVIDEAHRPAVDPVGMAAVLTGQSTWLPWVLVPAAIVVAIRTLQVRLVRVRPKHGRTPDHPLLSELDP